MSHYSLHILAMFLLHLKDYKTVKILVKTQVQIFDKIQVPLIFL